MYNGGNYYTPYYQGSVEMYGRIGKMDRYRLGSREEMEVPISPVSPNQGQNSQNSSRQASVQAQAHQQPSGHQGHQGQVRGLGQVPVYGQFQNASVNGVNYMNRMRINSGSNGNSGISGINGLGGSNGLNSRSNLNGANGINGLNYQSQNQINQINQNQINQNQINQNQINQNQINQNQINQHQINHQSLQNHNIQAHQNHQNLQHQHQIQHQIQQPQNLQNHQVYPMVPHYSHPKSVQFPVHKLTSSMLSMDCYNMLVMVYQKIHAKKYATSAINPVRNYLTVYEYSVHNQWIIWDYETGYVHLTGLWKSAEAATNKAVEAGEFDSHRHKSKADIVKLLDSTPKQYHGYIKRIRGGVLKIQGTWLPYTLCKILARRFSYYIRFELIPIFGDDFPDYCLLPDDVNFGDLRFDDSELEGTTAQERQERGERYERHERQERGERHEEMNQREQRYHRDRQQRERQRDRQRERQQERNEQREQVQQIQQVQHIQQERQPRKERDSKGVETETASTCTSSSSGSSRTPVTESPQRRTAFVPQTGFDVNEASQCLQAISNASQVSPISQVSPTHVSPTHVSPYHVRSQTSPVEPITSYFDMPKSNYTFPATSFSFPNTANKNNTNTPGNGNGNRNGVGSFPSTTSVPGYKRHSESLQSPVSFTNSRRSGSFDKPFDVKYTQHTPSNSRSSIPPITTFTPHYQTPASQMIKTPQTPNYIISNKPESPKRSHDGISSLLLAANLTENPPSKARRISIKINDLLT